jgi:hypothetical protein
MHEFEFDAFLSYSHSDGLMATRIHDALEQRQVRLWIDRRLRPGDPIIETVETGIEDCYTFLLLVSHESLQSNWVRHEYLRAMSHVLREQQQRRLIVIRLSAIELPSYLQDRVWLDLSEPAHFNSSMDSLAAALLQGADDGSSRAPRAADLASIIGSARQRLTVVGHEVHLLLEASQRRALELALERGVHVTLVVFQPGLCTCGASCGTGAHSGQSSEHACKQCLQRLAHWLRLLGRKSSAGIDVWIGDHAYGYRAILVDDSCCHVHLYFFDAAEAPQLRLHVAEGANLRWFHFVRSEVQALLHCSGLTRFSAAAAE